MATTRKKADPDVQLLRAVGRFVESKGGKVIVAGGITIESWPGKIWPEADEFTFYIKVKCTGRKPEAAR